MFGAGDEIRTRDIQLGKLTLYQLSYSRLRWVEMPGVEPGSEVDHPKLTTCVFDLRFLTDWVTDR